MSQHCPVCKTRLWTDPLFTPSRLRCPRCGAEFRSTVSWTYFRILLVIALGLCLLLLLLVTGANLWLFPLFLGFGILLWFIRRIVDFQYIGPELTPTEGLLDAKQLKLDLEDAAWDRKSEENREKQRFHGLLFLVFAFLVLALLTAIFWPKS